ncbi:hypothetical protein [Metasolibacillus sp.]|uniref:hypothetical protein n=1 Tax=Metasolibacillus sp. TaxID=2703680 RepID=UPI0025D00779|nr:hypothetical protein [Metasolibacillus sp.]MCT6925473.1 hypothetical protein [Metasolibacillus sp.]MCT6941730.1 hypothetical protein [Metasolibacillus sp.]
MKKYLPIYLLFSLTVSFTGLFLPYHSTVANADTVEPASTNRKFVTIEVIIPKKNTPPPLTYLYNDGTYAGHLTLDTYYRDKDYLYHGFYVGYVSMGNYPTPTKAYEQN